jgi:hypothetical protein
MGRKKGGDERLRRHTFSGELRHGDLNESHTLVRRGWILLSRTHSPSCFFLAISQWHYFSEFGLSRVRVVM